LLILSNTLEKVEDMNDKSIKCITFIEAAKSLNISESTLRRKLNKLPKSDLTKLTKVEKGRVFINANIVNIFNHIDYNDKIENTIIEPGKIHKESQNEIEYLRKQNDSFMNTISEKDSEIRNLTSLVVKLQNDINGYIKQLGEGAKDREPITDKILKIVLVVVLVALSLYLIFG
jgi:DNA-binding Lrp family transcriptional regulator